MRCVARSKVADAQREVAKSSVDIERTTSQSENAIDRYVTRGLANLGMMAKSANDNIGVLNSSLLVLGAGVVGVAVVTAGIALMSKTAYDAIIAFSKLQDAQTKFNAQLNATGSASGKISEDVERLAKSIGDLNSVREASQELLKFRSIGGETFDRVLKVASDLSATEFGNLTASAKALGQALQSLNKDGLAPLEQAGLAFSTAQKAMMKDMVETERAAEAQRLALDLVERRHALGGLPGA